MSELLMLQAWRGNVDEMELTDDIRVCTPIKVYTVKSIDSRNPRPSNHGGY